MDVSHIFDHLNTVQREAVCAPAEPTLVLAGAGSGKTRVLAHRIAWLIQACAVSPLEILAVTFTNKAAQEMRSRIETLLDTSFRGLWVGTFHGIGHRLLRMYHEEAGLPENFEVIDSVDQFRLLKKILKQLNLDEAYWPPKQIQWMINNHKEEARRATALPPGKNIQQQTLHRVYVAYEDFCKRNGLVDFSEILLRTLELFKYNQNIRETFQSRFLHVLVDEFQDTNSIQYQWLKILADKHKNLFSVGDDDQSIYGWRGAKVENILNFERDFKDTQLFRLEQNYRSSGNILNAANAVIANNAGRMGKELWTEKAEGFPIRQYAASNETDEARFVVEQIQTWIQAGNQRNDCAILYRSNAQSRVFEEQLIAQGIPYRVYGGLRFFERAEIKDALAYLRLVSNQDSDPAFERIVNHPPRGIGNRTLEIIRERSRNKQISMWQATTEVIANCELPPRAISAASQFQELINQLDKETDTFELAEKIDHIIQKSGLMNYFKNDRSEIAQTRIENLQELVNAARNFVVDIEIEEEDTNPLTVFLTHTALEAGESQADEWQDCIQLMSLHSAKGLEFNLVFLCGLEEGLFPHQRSLEEPGRLEEERRLCYVGMTRAKEQLYICYAEIRRLYGKEHYTQPSRFLGEMPEKYIEEIRSPRISRPLHRSVSHRNADNSSIVPGHEVGGLKPGTHVRHKKFGEGVVINLEGQGNHARVQVNFPGPGSKWLVCSYANLEILG